MVLVEHRGVTSAREHRTVLAVKGWDPSDRRVVVTSTSDCTSGWYRDLLAHPTVRVTIARERRVVASAVALGSSGGTDWLRASPPDGSPPSAGPRGWRALPGRVLAAIAGHVPGWPARSERKACSLVLELAPRRTRERRAA
jgi:hypothetical protein